MNWQAIGALGEIVGAIAVVVSLLYLATQVRQGTRAMRSQAAHDALGAILDFNKAAEAMHSQFLNGTLEEDTWHAHEYVFAEYAKSPGFAAYWSLRAEAYSPAFRALYDSWPEGGGKRLDEIVHDINVDRGLGVG